MFADTKKSTLAHYYLLLLLAYWVWELDYKESWAQKNWCFWTVVLEKTLESPLDCKEIQPVHSEGDQPWVFFGRNDAKAETPVLWLPDTKSWLIGKDPDAGRDWGQEEKGMTEDEMAGWHHWLDVCDSEWISGVGDGQGGLTCCNSWGLKKLDKTERLKWTEVNWPFILPSYTPSCGSICCSTLPLLPGNNTQKAIDTPDTHILRPQLKGRLSKFMKGHFIFFPLIIYYFQSTVE